ncbi:hypothetical protein [Nocardia blacklockiae]|uniref:hypothetical protein n=1 Tax=Nocardia blacklockiae TaxID=480036 RepID=UPI0018956282|nr:hypothetical protein [Nocardia blacklockiae]MBF6171098.1 hypothetical protein [Nocardia blacklockiae]
MPIRPDFSELRMSLSAVHDVHGFERGHVTARASITVDTLERARTLAGMFPEDDRVIVYPVRTSAGIGGRVGTRFVFSRNAESGESREQARHRYLQFTTRARELGVTVEFEPGRYSRDIASLADFEALSQSDDLFDFFRHRYAREIAAVAAACVSGATVASQGSTTYAVYGQLPSTAIISVSNDRMQGSVRTGRDDTFGLEISIDGYTVASIYTGTLRQQLDTAASLTERQLRALAQDHRPPLPGSVEPTGLLTVSSFHIEPVSRTGHLRTSTP